MTENNAAQPGLTDEEIIKHLEDAGVSFMWVHGRSPLHTTTGSQKSADIVAGIRALLSKLRAEGVQAGGFPAYINDDSQPLQYRLGWNNCLSDCRAALASAPVAGKDDHDAK